MPDTINCADGCPGCPNEGDCMLQKYRPYAIQHGDEYRKFYDIIAEDIAKVIHAVIASSPELMAHFSKVTLPLTLMVNAAVTIVYTTLKQQDEIPDAFKQAFDE